MLHLHPACLNFGCLILQQKPKSLRAGLLLAFLMLSCTYLSIHVHV